MTKRIIYYVQIICLCLGCNSDKNTEIEVYRFADYEWSKEISIILTKHSQNKSFFMTIDSINIDSLLISISEIDYIDIENIATNYGRAMMVVELQKQYLYTLDTVFLKFTETVGKKQKIKYNMNRSVLHTESLDWYFLYTTNNNKIQFLSPNVFAFTLDSVAYDYIDFRKTTTILNQ